MHEHVRYGKLDSIQTTNAAKQDASIMPMTSAMELDSSVTQRTLVYTTHLGEARNSDGNLIIHHEHEKIIVNGVEEDSLSALRDSC